MSKTVTVLDILGNEGIYTNVIDFKVTTLAYQFTNIVNGKPVTIKYMRANIIRLTLTDN